MKKIFLIIIVSFFFINLNAQVNPEDNSKRGGGFASLNLNFGAIDGNFAFFTGGGGGFIVKDIRIGVFFSGLTSKVSIKIDSTNNKHKLSCSYGGLWVGYPLWKNKRFHAMADLKIGIGNIHTVNAENYDRMNNTIFYNIIPSLGAEYYITESFAIAFGVEYRYCIFPQNEVYDKSMLNTPSAYLSLKLGLF